MSENKKHHNNIKITLNPITLKPILKKSKNKMTISNIKSVIKDFKKGKFVIVVDDKSRENEADLVLAAEKVSPEKINFMIKNARGLVCIPMLGKRLDELKLKQMTNVNTEFHNCKFTVSVDYRHGTTTGISAFDRARTIKALTSNKTMPNDLLKPGHILLLCASCAIVWIQVGCFLWA